MQALLLLSVLGITKVVVIAPPHVSEALVTDVLRELRVAGYTIDRDVVGDLAASAEAHDAVAAMVLGETPESVSVEVFGVLGQQSKTRYKEMPMHDANDRRVASLRAVEIVRGVLLELGVQPPTPISEFVNPYESVTAKKDTLAAVDAAMADEPTPLAPALPPRFRWLVGAGAGVVDVGRPEGVATLMLGRRFGRLLADASLTGAFTARIAHSGGAEASVRPFAVRLAAGPLFSFAFLDVSPFAAVSLDFLAVHGSAPPPFVAHTTVRPRPELSAGGRLMHRFENRMWLGLCAQAGWVAPVRVTIVDRRALDLGPLAISAELLVGWVLD
jgi:hypothetical protein